VQNLQRTFMIPADRVYLLSELDSSIRSPGEAFPSEAFAGRLLRPSR